MYQVRHRSSRAVVGAVAAMVSLLVLAGTAAAHHAEVTAAYGCDGKVSFTAYAWNGPTNASKTNSDIGVWYRLDGGAFVELTSPAYHFDAGNAFQFSDAFDGQGALVVTVKVQAQANWGNGVAPGDSRQATVSLPVGCQPATTPVPPTEVPPTEVPPTTIPVTEVLPIEVPPIQEEPIDAAPTLAPTTVNQVLAATGAPTVTPPPTSTDDSSSEPQMSAALVIGLLFFMTLVLGVSSRRLRPIRTRR